MTTTVLRPQVVTWVSEELPTQQNFGKTGYLALQGAGGRQKYGLLQFSNPFPSDGGNVLSAHLVLRTRAITSRGPHTIRARLSTVWPVRPAWTSWSRMPGGIGDVVVGTRQGVQPAGQVWDLDVTALMQRVASGDAFYGFQLGTADLGMILVEGNMSSAVNPSLEIEWTQAPLPPDNLAPSAGRMAGSPSPVLRWDFFDHAGDEGMLSCQVQVSDSESMVDAWDSGVVEATSPELDLAGTDFPGVGDGQTVFWRVRNQDTGGAWSEWSDVASFGFAALPGVKILNPPPPADDDSSSVVTDPTPPVDWAFEGGEQTRWLVAVDELVDGSVWRTVWSSGVRSGSETRATPEVAMTEAGSYRVTVQCWDTAEREATPGLHAYGWAQRIFRFETVDSVPSIRDLSVETSRVMPEVTLRWGRDEQPDRWTVWRDFHLMSVHDGDEFLQPDGSYMVVDREAPAGRHVYAIFPTVDGKTSASGRVTVDVPYTGSWLIHQDTHEMVRVHGDTDHDMKLAESATTHELIGGGAPVTIVSAQRGFEGTISGDLVATPGLPEGQSPIEWRRRMIVWRRDVGARFRLLTEDQTILCTISDVNLVSFPGAMSTIWKTSFAFRQVGDWLDGVQW